jgi:hypothetical protein
MMPPVRRSLAVLIAALLAAVFAVAGTSGPANAAPKSSLKIVSVTNTEKPVFGTLLIQEQAFKVVVEAVDGKQQPITVSKATTIELKESGTGTFLTGTTKADIPVGGSRVTFSNLTYSPYENDVLLDVSVISGVGLAPDTYTVDVALTAVAKHADPKVAVEVTDSECLAPTAKVPTCGQLLLPNGADGQVTMSVGSCKNLGACRSTDDGTTALVVTADADLIDGTTKLYNKTAPATLIIACDKDLCRATANGVPKMPVIYTFDNDGALTEKAEPCPSKGTLADLAKACVDYVSSSRSDGDVYLHLLYAIDMRGSL